MIKFDFEKGNALLRAAAFEVIMEDARKLYAGSGDAEAAARLACDYFAVQIMPAPDKVSEDSEAALARLIEFDPAEIADALRSPPVGEARSAAHTGSAGSKRLASNSWTTGRASGSSRQRRKGNRCVVLSRRIRLTRSCRSAT
jgi:hypothetical protein